MCHVRNECCTFLRRLDYEGNIKVSDFGLSEDIYVTGYFRQNKDDPVKLPFKWMAPESLRDGMFSHKSDVVNFFEFVVLEVITAFFSIHTK